MGQLMRPLSATRDKLPHDQNSPLQPRILFQLPRTLLKREDILLRRIAQKSKRTSMSLYTLYSLNVVSKVYSNDFFCM